MTVSPGSSTTCWLGTLLVANECNSNRLFSAQARPQPRFIGWLPWAEQINRKSPRSETMRLITRAVSNGSSADVYCIKFLGASIDDKKDRFSQMARLKKSGLY